MTAPVPSWPLLPGERQRLETLRSLDILDTPPEERFDRIVRAASRLLGTPISAVSLIDEDRQWFKASVGIEGTQTPRSDSVCAHTILRSGILTVPDLLADPRFARIGATRPPARARSYAGRPIRFRDQALGALCVLDTRPREFTAEEKAVLEDLGSWAEAEMRAHAAERRATGLDALQHRTELVLASVAEAILGADEQGRIAFLNSRTEELTGWTRDELIGRDLHTTLHGRRADGSPYAADENPIVRTLRTGVPMPLGRQAIWTRSGRPVTVDYSCGAVREEDRIVGIVAVYADATDRAELERAKDNLISLVSHELRTPLTSVIGALELLDDTIGESLDPGSLRMLRIAASNAGRLARLVDDILLLEKSSRGELTLRPAALSVPDLLETAAETVRVQADKQQVGLRLEPVAATLHADEQRMVQVLDNVLANAIRFSPAGQTVTLAARLSGPWVELLVTDRGEGIPPEEAARVFDRFWQAPSGHGLGGTGLGLSIARSMVEAHGGTIALASRPGSGTTVTIRLPLADAGAGAGALTDEPAPRREEGNA